MNYTANPETVKHGTGCNCPYCRPKKKAGK